jgi:hypothetical protein
MVETISPVVHGGRRTRYWRSVLLHVVGAGLSAAAVGLLLGAFGALLGAPWGTGGLIGVAAVAVLYAAGALGAPVPIPDRHRQVPEWWRTFFSPEVSAFLYGLGLGVGFLTFLSVGTYVAVAAGAIATGRPLLGAAVCAPFGVTRALTVLLARTARRSEDAGAVVDRIEDLAGSRLQGLGNAAVLTAVAVAALLAIT